jgi:hypothetical protein
MDVTGTVTQGSLSGWRIKLFKIPNWFMALRICSACHTPFREMP